MTILSAAALHDVPDDKVVADGYTYADLRTLLADGAVPELLLLQGALQSKIAQINGQLELSASDKEAGEEEDLEWKHAARAARAYTVANLAHVQARVGALKAAKQEEREAQEAQRLEEAAKRAAIPRTHAAKPPRPQRVRLMLVLYGVESAKDLATRLAYLPIECLPALNGVTMVGKDAVIIAYAERPVLPQIFPWAVRHHSEVVLSSEVEEDQARVA